MIEPLMTCGLDSIYPLAYHFKDRKHFEEWIAQAKEEGKQEGLEMGTKLADDVRRDTFKECADDLELFINSDDVRVLEDLIADWRKYERH